MARVSPIADLHRSAEAVLAPYGPPDGPIAVVMTYGDLASEYAAVRKSCLLIDQPQRGTILVSGPDAQAFLNRMVTQELKSITPGAVRRSFWLNRKGRIDADLRIIRDGDTFVLDLDAHAVERTVKGLGDYIVADDVTIEDRTEQSHRLALHGPAALALAARFAPAHAGELQTLQPGQARRLEFAGVPALVDRADPTGEPGLELLVGAADTRRLAEALLAAAHEHGPDPARPNPRPPLRPGGWLAFNMARIEAGTPIYNIDYGPDSLPAETGVLNDRVSFTKGCYLGQEVVARMHALGHPKQVLVGFEVADAPPSDSGDLREPPQPGAAVFPADAAGKPAGDAVGAVTSATISPMKSQAIVGFAMMKWAHATPGAAVCIATEATHAPARILPALRSLPPR